MIGLLSVLVSDPLRSPLESPGYLVFGLLSDIDCSSRRRARRSDYNPRAAGFYSMQEMKVMLMEWLNEGVSSRDGAGQDT